MLDKPPAKAPPMPSPFRARSPTAPGVGACGILPNGWNGDNPWPKPQRHAPSYSSPSASPCSTSGATYLATARPPWRQPISWAPRSPMGASSGTSPSLLSAGPSCSRRAGSPTITDPGILPCPLRPPLARCSTPCRLPSHPAPHSPQRASSSRASAMDGWRHVCSSRPRVWKSSPTWFSPSPAVAW